MSWAENLRKELASPEAFAPDPGIQTTIHSSVIAAIGWEPETERNQIVLMKRTMTVGFHKGQISFPGGIREKTDGTLLETALREAEEEIGLKRSDVEILGGLDPVTTRADVIIYPWVGRLILPYEFQLSPAEVDRLLFLPLGKLLSEGLKEVDVPVGGFKVKSIAIEADGELIWGATARILEQLRLACLAAGAHGPI